MPSSRARQRLCSWLMCTWVALSACGRTAEGPETDIGSETNWLRQCQSSAQCGSGSCVCGVCSQGCQGDADCPSGLRCKREDSALYAQACGVDALIPGLCAPECEEASECGGELSCVGGTCGPPASDAPSDAGLGLVATANTQLSGAARQLVIDAHVAESAECLPDPERPIGSGVGLLDIYDEGTCSQPYRLNLRVRNLLPEAVIVSRVDVLIMNVQEQGLLFDSDDGLVPNPFQLSVTGSVPAATTSGPGLDVIVAEAIPRSHAKFLSEFVDDQVAVRVQLSGETLTGEAVRSNAFEYRLGICVGCLRSCHSEIDGANPTAEELNGGNCAEHGGSDGRVCIDPDC